MKTETVRNLAALIGGRVVGDEETALSGIADLRDAAPDKIGFVRDPRYAALIGPSRVGCVLVREELDVPVTQIVVDEPHLAFAKVALHFHPLPVASEHRIHPTAFVDPDADLEEPVEIGPHATVGRGSRIGAGTTVGAGAVIGEDVRIGRASAIFARAVIYERSKLGDRVIVHSGAVIGSEGFGYARDAAEWVRQPQVGDVVLEDDVEIGANTAIDRGALGSTRIGRGTKIDNLVHVGHNCDFGEDCIVAGLSAFAGSTKVGDRVTIGGHVVTAGHLRIGDDVRIGGNSGVLGDLIGPGDFMGFPPQPVKRWMRTLAAINRLADLRPELDRLLGAGGEEG